MKKLKDFSVRFKRESRIPRSQTNINDQGPSNALSHQEVSWCPAQDPLVATRFPDGVEVLYDCPGAVLDICFIHGLTGDRRATWTPDQASEPWPQTLLPSHISGARILTYGYDAYFVRKSAASCNRVIDHAINLLHDLTTDRASCNASSRPLIFIAHSLGGLVCKKAILLSRNNPEYHLRSVFKSTKAIIFMGTPHKGSWMADWAKIPATALGFIKSTNKSLFAVLESESQFLESLQIEFLALIRELREAGRSLEVTSFFEELPLPLAGRVVSKESATLDGYNSISIHANHSDMVKFGSEEETGFKRLVGELQRWQLQLRYVLSKTGGKRGANANH
ncbi:alpha/beta-hydrolase [Penicillium malachiteum]|nr:alpha/beta-hydrolase [Penicillium malachiteum]